MKAFKFQGYSDDTFGEYNITNDDYDNCASGEPIQYLLQTPDGAGIIVTGLYGHKINKSVLWMIGVEAVSEQKTIDWEITIKPNHEGYRNQLIVIAPDNAKLTCLNRKIKMEPTQEIPQDVKETKQFRKDLDAILQQIKTASRQSRERSLSITKIQEAIMWLGMDLKTWNEENGGILAKPYPESYNPESPKIEPPADGLKL